MADTRHKEALERFVQTQSHETLNAKDDYGDVTVTTKNGSLKLNFRNSQEALEILVKNPPTNSLKLCYFDIGAENARILSGNTSLKCLRFSSCLGDELVEPAQMQQLCSLGYKVTDIGREFVHSLHTNSSIKHLSFECCTMGPGVYKELAQLPLQKLDVVMNRLCDEDTLHITCTTSIVELNVSHNEIGVEGAKTLANCTSLRVLSLQNNYVSDDTTELLARSANLTQLDVSCNPLTDVGARNLALSTSITNLSMAFAKIGTQGTTALAQNTVLQELCLYECGLKDDQIGIIASSQNILVLDVSANHVGTAGAQALAKNDTLLGLGVAQCHMGGEQVQELAKNTSITTLDLLVNLLGDAEIYELMKGNTTITEFRAGTSPLQTIAQRNKHSKREKLNGLASLFSILIGLKRSQKRRLVRVGQ